MNSKASPTSSSERIVAIDVLRGFAVLGILLINIQSFSMIEAAYLNPTANDKLEGVGRALWATTFVLGDQKFMTIFSILFGAGIVLMTARAEARGQKTSGLHYRRNLWLLGIGLAHAHLLWYGDILVAYAICAFVVYLFRKRSPRTLIALGCLTLLVSPAIYTALGWSIPNWPVEASTELAASWAPSPEDVMVEIEAYRGGWLEQQPLRSSSALAMETVAFAVWGFWRAAGLMLIGMALFKLGVLSAERSDSFYRRMAMLGLLLGLPLVIFGVFRNLAAGYAFEYSMFLGVRWNYFGSLGMSLAYIALVMLAVRGAWLPSLQRRLAATGRMALTNYLSQTMLCTLIFYGHGLGLFERVARPGQLLIVLAIWLLQLWWSPLWLARFRFGPFEWLWRSLTYLRWQPMRG